MQERIIELTSQLVAIPTHDREQDAQELLATWLEAAGFDCDLQEIEPGRPNLVAQRGRGGAFVCSHIDVHPPHGHPDPWRCRRVGSDLVGRGVLDAKGQIAALVTALESVPDEPALVAITCDEERMGRGSELLRVPDGPWRVDGGIVLEPTRFWICTAQAGHIDLKVEVSGTPSHAYAEETSGSPLAAVLSVIEEIDTLRFLRAEHALLGTPRKNVGTIAAGEHAWRRPARASVEISLGVAPGTELADAEREVRDRLDELARRWGRRETSFLYDIVDSTEPIEIPADLAAASWLFDAPGTPLHPGGMPSWTDAGNLLTRHGIPCVVFGAGDLASAHSDHEWVAVDDLVQLAGMLAYVLTSAGTAR